MSMETEGNVTTHTAVAARASMTGETSGSFAGKPLVCRKIPRLEKPTLYHCLSTKKAALIISLIPGPENGLEVSN